ncbi:MAG: HNH/ENDO VII family nuclease [Saccharofermentans sp.]|nr:HNH/ENDO VII family nuclease [Saccharofermentans sp.]
MKKLISLVLVSSLLLVGCSAEDVVQNESSIDESSAGLSEYESNYVDLRDISYLDNEAEEMNFDSLSDPELLDFMEGAVYYNLIDEIGEDAYIENVSAVYISQEYIDELTYNSRANIFFGYTLQELNEQFVGQRYVFTVEDGQTVVQPMPEYDDTYYQIVRNVAIGTGVILLCVTVSVVTGGLGAPAASMIFAVAAQSGAVMGLSSGVISGAAAGLTTGIRTGDWDQAMSDAALAGSEGFMMGAICGAIAGGAGEAIGLHGATLNGLTMDQAATIQRESKIPLKLIQEFQSMEQYEIIRDSGMFGGVVDGSPALIRKIDLNFVDEAGRTNLERMRKGLAALDPETGLAYELHHLGQTQDATMAILTQAEHRGVGNHAIWHDLVSESVVDHGSAWAAQRSAFWKSLASVLPNV